MPNLKFKVQEPATFFHFLDSISQWDIHTRVRIREYYEEMVGISKEDEKYIKKYIKIRKKYPWKTLDSDFIPAKNFNEVEENLKNRLTKKEFVEMNEIIKHFHPPIHKIYLNWYKYYEKKAKILEIEAEKLQINNILEKIKNFYESEYNHKNIYVHLVINPTNLSQGGGANINPGYHITLERFNLNNKKEIKSAIGVVVHEVLHLIEAQTNKQTWEKVENKTLEKNLEFYILREAIADTIAPDGVLTQQYKLTTRNILSYKNSPYPQKNSSKPDYYYKMRTKLSAYIYPLTKKQFKNNLSLFDGDYIDKCIKEFQKIKDFVKKDTST